MNPEKTGGRPLRGKYAGVAFRDISAGSFKRNHPNES